MKNQNKDNDEKIVAGTVESPNFDATRIPDAFGMSVEEYTQVVQGPISEMYAAMENQSEDLRSLETIATLIRESDLVIAVACLNMLIGNVTELYDMKSALNTLIMRTVRPMLAQELGKIQSQLHGMTEYLTNTAKENTKDSGIIIP